MVDGNALLINSTSIDHLQNHFLPGNVGLTCEMSYYLTPSPNNSAHTIITQLACVDYRFDLSFCILDHCIRSFF